MKPTLKLLMIPHLPIFEQLQLEEALLRADEENWCLINHGSSPAIVMGISGKSEQLINNTHFYRQPIPVVRRFSGGGTVIVDENTYFVTLICQSKATSTNPQHLLSWTESLYKPMFAPHDFHLVENDYVIGHKKCAGNAQYLRKDRWLQHTSFLWDYQDIRMDYLLMPPKVPSYRQSRPHSDFLCRIKDFLPSKELMTQNLLNTLKQQFHVQEADLRIAKGILERPHRKATKIEKTAERG